MEPGTGKPSRAVARGGAIGRMRGPYRMTRIVTPRLYGGIKEVAAVPASHLAPTHWTNQLPNPSPAICDPDRSFAAVSGRGHRL